MRNKYTLGKFFNNAKEYGIRKAFKIDASETFDDAKYLHRGGLDLAKIAKKENAIFLEKSINNNSLPWILVIPPAVYINRPFQIGLGYILGFLDGLVDITVGEKSLGDRFLDEKYYLVGNKENKLENLSELESQINGEQE